MRPVQLAVLILGVFAHSVAAQSPTPAAPRNIVTGVVFDSVAGKPLAGAVVHVAMRDAVSAPVTATTDSLGRYRVANLPSGQALVGFYHDALTTLGLDAPTRAVTLGADTLAAIDLAIPSSQAVRTLRCGSSSPFAPGMLVGFVRDAHTRAAIAGTTATVRWRAFALDSANFRIVEEHATARVDEDGAFVACHLPVDVPLDIDVTAPGYRIVTGPIVNVPTSGIAQLDVLLSDSVATTGASTIRGRVLRESGKAVASGRVVIPALGRDIAVQDGEFAATRMPAGTWVAEARVIGVEPQTMAITVADSAIATPVFTVSDHAQRMDAVTVVGKPDRDLWVLNDVLRRSRIGMGTTFLPGHPALRSATFTSDVMREARGFLYQGPNKVLARPTGRFGARCSDVAVYVNDVRQPDGFDGVDLVAPIGEVLAIETWPTLDFAPIQYRPSNLGNPSAGPGGAGSNPNSTIPAIGPYPFSRACALVLIWTRRHF